VCRTFGRPPAAKSRVLVAWPDRSMPSECRGVGFRDAVGDNDESVAVLRGAGFRVAVGDRDELVAVLVRYR